MDAVPSAFVTSLMEVIRIPRKCSELVNATELGGKYGTIAQEIYDHVSICRIAVPGFFCETPSETPSEGEVFSEAPVFHGESIKLRAIPPLAKHLGSLAVTARHLLFKRNQAPAKGASLQSFQRLMTLYRYVQLRSLTVERFPPHSIPRSSLFPGLTTFFNKVTLHYHSDTSSFREFLQALVAGKQLQTLAVVNSANRDPYCMFRLNPDDPQYFPRQNVLRKHTHPRWLLEALLVVFFQPQFFRLNLSVDFFWDSTFFYDIFLWNWLKRPEAFLGRTKCFKLLGAPLVKLLKKYGFRYIEGTQWEEGFPFPFGGRRFVLPHPKSVDHTLELTVFARMLQDQELELTNREFCERAAYFETRFHSNAELRKLPTMSFNGGVVDVLCTYGEHMEKLGYLIIFVIMAVSFFSKQFA
uniref:Nucleotid_trans domain-containing protein n=1 Tax=Steinernema glaseri TaxID=37863 RepID=A0A1I8AQV5_9BILA